VRLLRQERYHKKSHKKAIWITLATIVVLIVLGIVFFFPLNNTVRTISGGGDTPSDKIVKNELIKKVDSTRNGDLKHDQKIDKATKALRKTKMSDIIQAANNQKKAASLLQKNSALTSSQANAATKTIFSNSKYNGLRQSVSKGNWYSVFKQYKDLSNDGSLTKLKNSISNK